MTRPVKSGSQPGPQDKARVPSRQLHVVPRTPACLIAAANAYVGLDLSAGFGPLEGPAAQEGVRRFPIVEQFLTEVRAFEEPFPFSPGDPTGARRAVPKAVSWDAAFVYHVGYWSHYGGAAVPTRSSWPLGAAATAADVAAVAARSKMLTDEPLEGDLFLLWNAVKGCFVRTGIVVDVAVRKKPFGPGAAHICSVVEGDTSPARRAGGGRVLRQLRVFGAQDRFVRWCGPRNLFPEHEEELAG